MDFDPTVLEEIATKTGGKFFHANTFEKLQQIYAQINSLEKSEIKTNKFIKKEYFYQYPLDIALVLLFMLLILNWKYS